MTTYNKFLFGWTIFCFIIIGSPKLFLDDGKDNDKITLYLTAEWCGHCDDTASNIIDIESPIGRLISSRYNIRTVPTILSVSSEEFIKIVQLQNDILEEALWITLKSATVHINSEDLESTTVSFDMENFPHTKEKSMTIDLNNYEVDGNDIIFYNLD